MRRSTSPPNRRSQSVLGVMLLLALPALAQSEGGSWDDTSWWLRLKSTGYAYQTTGPADTEQDHFGFYQHYDGSVSGLMSGKLSFRASGRFADDLIQKQRNTDQERLYVAYAQMQFHEKGRGRLGRQFLNEGPSSTLIDGLWLDLSPIERWELHAWGGAATPASRIYELGDFGDDLHSGVRVKGRPMRRLQVAGSWSLQQLGGETDAQPVGAEIYYNPLAWMRVRGDLFYELEQEEWNRANVVTQVYYPDMPTLTLQYLDRTPRIGAASYFSRFDVAERIRVGRASLDFRHDTGLNAELEYFGSWVDTRSTAHIGGLLGFYWVRAGYAVRVGDSGEEDRWYGDLNFQATNWLLLQGGAALSTYALLENAPSDDERDLVTAFARVRADLRPGLRLTAEVQGLENPNYDEDIRFLVGLDLSMGRGASRFGLGEGGWFE